MPEIKPFDLGQVFDVTKKGLGYLDYAKNKRQEAENRKFAIEDRNMAIQDRQRNIQNQQQTQQQQGMMKAQKDMDLIMSNIDTESPTFDTEFKKAMGWVGTRNPQIAGKAYTMSQRSPEEQKMFIENLKRQRGVTSKTEQLTIYGPNGETKRVAVEKGKDFTPPKNWSLSKPKGKGIVIYDEQGNPQVSIGGEVSKKTQGTVEGGVVADLSSLQQLNKIEVLAKDNPELFTYGSQIGTGIDVIAEKAGFERTDEEKERLRKWQDLSMNISQSFNTYRKEITGAAASEQELKRLEEDYINKKMSHTQFMQALGTLKTKMERGLVLKQNLLQRGVKFNSKEYKKYFDANGFPIKGKEVDRPSVNERAGIIKKQNPSFTSDKIFEILADEGY